MIAVEIDGVRVEAENEKDAKRMVSKAVRQSKKLEAERIKLRNAARLQAQANGYKVLSRKAAGEAKKLPHGWTFYRPGQNWSEHIFKQTGDDHRGYKHVLNVQEVDSWVVCDHYGMILVGGVCNGAGYCWLVFLRDASRPDDLPTCYAVGAAGDQICLEECPGVCPDDFRSSGQDNED